MEFALTAWKIWKRMNEFVFSNTFIHPKSVIQAVKLFIEDIHQTQQLAHKCSIGSNDHSQWEALPRGKLKLNYDATIDKTNCKVGVGAIVRDWEWKVRATLRMSHALFLDRLIAEAFAAFQASMFLKYQGGRM